MYAIKETDDNTWTIFYGDRIIARAWSLGFSDSWECFKIRVNMYRNSFLMMIPELNKDCVLNAFSDQMNR